MLRPGPIAALVAAGMSAFPVPAWAYRPFDSTDAAVASSGEVEIELGPAGYLHGDAGTAWIAPSLTVNFGLSDRWEAVLEGDAMHGAGQSRFGSFAASLKTILRPGSLQGEDGLSWATEASLLLPGIRTDNGMGLEWTGIASRKTTWGAFHVNFGAGLSREGHGLAFAGLILEGPQEWTLRPVAELRYERTFGMEDEASVLLGLIWKAGETCEMDLAARHASIRGRPEDQIRAGLTFAMHP